MATSRRLGPQRGAAAWGLAAVATVVAIGCGSHAAEPPACPEGSAAVASAGAPGRLELGRIVAEPTWSEDGRYVMFRTSEMIEAPGAGPGGSYDYVVIDATAHTTLLIERAHHILFTPDHHHLAVVSAGVLTVYALATGAIVGPAAPITSYPTFGLDGRLVWAELAGTSYRIHVREAATGAETVLVGLPAGNEPAREEAVSFDFGDDGEASDGKPGAPHRLLAYTTAGIRVWQDDRPEPIVRVPGSEYPYAALSPEGLAYTTVDGRDRQSFAFVDLSGPSPAPVELARDGRCGAGAMAEFTRFDRCAANRYMVQTGAWFCIWDTQQRKVQARFRSRREESHCEDDLAWVGDLPPGGPYDYYSTVTGKRARAPRTDELPVDGSDARAREAADAAVAAVRAAEPEAVAIASSPSATLVAGSVHGRATLWTAAGAVVWRAAQGASVAGVGFAPDGSLVAVGTHGQVWRVDRTSGKLETGQLTGCELAAADPIAVAPDGRAVAVCLREGRHALVIEGVEAPLFHGEDYGWDLSLSGTTAAWRSGDAIRAFAIPDGKPRWSYEIAALLANSGPSQRTNRESSHEWIDSFVVAGDGARFAFTTARKDPQHYEPTYRVAIRDASNQQLARGPLGRPGVASSFSPDGTRLALRSFDHTVTIDDLKRGGSDETTTPGTALAWDAAGERLATWRTEPPGLVIRDVVAKRDVEVRPLTRRPAGLAQRIAWSADGARLAALIDHAVTVWDSGGPPRTFSFGGAGAVELHPDRTVTLLGEPAAARALVDCVLDGRDDSAGRCARSLRPR